MYMHYISVIALDIVAHISLWSSGHHVIDIIDIISETCILFTQAHSIGEYINNIEVLQNESEHAALPWEILVNLKLEGHFP